MCPLLIICSFLLLVMGGASPAEEPGASKALIEFGWDEPDTAFLRQHIAAMERTPFDGCVFHVNAVPSEGPPVNFAWACWGRRAFAEDDLRQARDDLKATSWARFTRN